jgi:hypothetical protein
VGAEIENVVNSLGGPGSGYEFFGAAIQAPIVEETGKGFGLLLMFWFARKLFDGPVDGLVYAAWIAGGFAFTENILYFGSQLVTVGGVDGSVVELFLIRGIMSPFAHVMFTACTGIALGFAARRTGALGAIGYFLIGLVPAILLHALWNGALFFVDNFYVYFAVVQFPLFVLSILLVVALRRQETKLTHDRLAEYAAAGWFAADEVTSLAKRLHGRRARARVPQCGNTFGIRRASLSRDSALSRGAARQAQKPKRQHCLAQSWNRARLSPRLPKKLALKKFIAQRCGIACDSSGR